MFGDGHELEGVVAEFGDAGQDVFTKFVVGADAFAFGGDAEVCFVDERGGGFGRRGVLPVVGCFGVPDNGREFVGFGILVGEVGEGGEAVVGSVGPGHADFVFREVAEARVGRDVE